MLKQRDGPLPYLREYLASLSFVPEPGMAFLVLSVVSFVVAAALYLSPDQFVGAAIWGSVGCLSLGAARFMKLSHKKKFPRLYSDHHKQAVALGQEMFRAKRLHKSIDAGCAHLLEESARYWCEIKASLASPSWSRAELPNHWQKVKAQASAATDDAMEEMLLLLQGSYRPYAGPEGLQATVEDAVETFVTGPRFRKADMLPAEFEPARKLAEKLKLLAKQIRDATQDVTRETVILTPQEDVAAALDMAINDIRNIQSAEIELRNNA